VTNSFPAFAAKCSSGGFHVSLDVLYYYIINIQKFSNLSIWKHSVEDHIIIFKFCKCSILFSHKSMGSNILLVLKHAK
jgi:hypothetical protein